MGPESEELQSLMNALEEGEGDQCQYTCAHNLQGLARFGPTKVWVVPPPDVTLILQQAPSDTLKKALKQRGPEGVGHFIDHSCCPRHINTELAVRWVSDWAKSRRPDFMTSGEKSGILKSAGRSRRTEACHASAV